MKPLEIVLAFVILVVWSAIVSGVSIYVHDSRTILPDTVRTVEYVEVPVQVGVAVPGPVRVIRDTVRIGVKDTLEGILLDYAQYDSLTAVRDWTIDGEYIGHMELNYDPIERVLSYIHTPPPLKIETVEVTREMPVSIWTKAEYIAYGVVGGVVLTLLLNR